jgi:excinuclease ABC subunit C
MNHYVSGLQFEKAEIIRKKLDGLENYQARSVIVSKSISNLDVFSILREKDTAYVNYLMVQNGTIVQTHTIILEIKLDETDEEILMLAIIDLRAKFNSMSSEVVVPFSLNYEGEEFVVTIPKAGDKKKLLDLSEKNVNYFMEEMRRKKMLRLEGSTDLEKKQVLAELQQALHLPEFPVQIECFDNSNFQGSYPVAAMVYFKNGLPDKSNYRKFNIKTVQGINDFASMKEVVSRRYSRLLNENLSLPQLIIIDGGKGQLNAAMEGLKEIGMEGKTAIVGLAKNEEEIFFPGDKDSIKLPWNSESLKLIRRIRDEVHRFGISFHRNQRSRGTFVNELESIKGIGKNTADILLKKYRSVKNIKLLSKDELSRAIGNAKAEIIHTYFNSAKKEADL